MLRIGVALTFIANFSDEYQSGSKQPHSKRSALQTFLPSDSQNSFRLFSDLFA